jgi:hypothetical protein
MRASRLLTAILPVIASLAIGACSFDIDKWFERDDPAVEQARKSIAEAGPEASDELQSARIALEELLRFRCEGDGGVDLVIDRPGAALDLGLVIFRLSELIGRRFGEEEQTDGSSSEGEELVMSARVKQLDCAHLLLLKIANDPKTPANLALRARYLLGNIAFLARKYQDAIARYDEVLLRHPARGTDPMTEVGPPSDDDAVARYAAWNRAIALERLIPPDAGDAGDGGDGSDGSDDASNDGSDGSNEAGDSGDGGGESGSDGSSDSKDGGGQEDGASDSGQGQSDSAQDTSAQQDTAAPSQPPPQPSASAMPSSSAAVDLRELDRFDQKAPLDLDFKARLREKKKIPKKFDK